MDRRRKSSNLRTWSGSLRLESITIKAKQQLILDKPSVQVFLIVW